MNPSGHVHTVHARASKVTEFVRSLGAYGPLPPGPVEPPAAQLLQFLRTPLPFLERARRTYGSPFTMRFPGIAPIVSHHHESAIRAIFQGDPHALYAGEANEVLEPMLGRNSLLLLDGDRHMSQRRLLLPPLKGERMKAYGDAMREVTEKEVAQWPIGRVFSLHEATQRITLDVIVRTVFGVHEGARMDRLRVLLTQTIEFGSRPELMTKWFQIDLGPRSPWGRFLRVSGEASVLIYELIREAREAADPDRVDILALLIQATHEDGAPMSDEEIHDELVTLLVAGHETTATALAWVGHRLIEHPEVQDRAIDEVRAAFPDGHVDAVAVSGLKYVDGVCKETLRIHPVVAGVGRRLQRPMRIDGRDLPAGVMAGISIYLTHFNEDLWPTPTRFDPERFVDQRISPYAFLPFGGGVRRCIGMAFAIYEMRIVLATILASRRFERADDEPIETVRRSVTLAPTRGMPVVVREV